MRIAGRSTSRRRQRPRGGVRNKRHAPLSSLLQVRRQKVFCCLVYFYNSFLKSQFCELTSMEKSPPQLPEANFLVDFVEIDKIRRQSISINFPKRAPKPSSPCLRTDHIFNIFNIIIYIINHSFISSSRPTYICHTLHVTMIPEDIHDIPVRYDR